LNKNQSLQKLTYDYLFKTSYLFSASLLDQDSLFKTGIIGCSYL